jgi:hypothetical protein
MPYNSAAAAGIRRNQENRLTGNQPGVKSARLPWLGLIMTLLLAAACEPGATPEAATAAVAPVATTAHPIADPPTSTATVTTAPTASQTAAPSATPSRTPTAEATLTPTATTTAATTSTNAPPTATTGSAQTIFNTPSVWNTSLAGPGVTTGSCSATVNPPYGLVLITPQGDTLLWHNTVPEDYVFQKTSDTTFLYAGPTGIGDGTVTMQLTFSSGEALQMTRAFIPNAEPGCTHTHTYSGAFQYFRP